MTFTVDIDAERALSGLDRMPQVMVQRIETAAERLAIKLEAHVQRDKLQGQVLNHRTGKLSRSIHHDGTASATEVTRRVYSAGVPYARIHEYGGQTPPHDIVPTLAAALAWRVHTGYAGSYASGHFGATFETAFAKVVHHPGSKIPERSYLRSALQDMKTEITKGMTKAAVQGAKSALGQSE